jgi:hypothetical protein
MMNAVNEWEELAGARLLEFLSARTRWNRSLWNAGLRLMLEEVLEASEAAQAGVLSPETLAYIVGAAMKTAAADPGVGDRSTLKALQEALQPKMRYNGLDYFAVQQLFNTLEVDYLAHWASYLDAHREGLNQERVARCIVSHQLDHGFNSDFLHRWWTFRLRYEAPRKSLGALVREAHALQLRGRQEFETVIAFERVPSERVGRPSGWMEPQGVTVWLQQQGFETVRQYGGVLLSITAYDPRAAADQATEIVESLAARARIAITAELRPHPKVWIAGESSPFDVRPRHRGLNVGALMREKVVYKVPATDDAVDAAFEILSPLQGSSPVLAVSAGWAAIEALLGESNDRGGAADRLAAIVACSFPRAELTALSYVLEREDPQVAQTLAGVAVNRDRALIVADAILAGQPLSLHNSTDRAALDRLRRIFRAPPTALDDIQQHVAGTFRRMYRQRNLVLHGGRTNPVALRSCLRTCAPLVGAGMDRIAHNYYVNGIRPLITAAQARNALVTLPGRKPRDCADMLP